MDTLKKYLLRFLLLYFALYIFPFPLNYLPFGIGDSLNDWVNSFWQWCTPWFAESILNYSGEISFNGRGSGDTTYDYLLLAVRLIFAVLGVFIWAVVQKYKELDGPLRRYLTVLFRYFLAFSMFTYGFSKIFYLQFPELSLINLSRTYGDSSPMGLLWKFMGYSETYSIFTGLLEVLGGALLLFRKTRLLGALLTFGVMLNVFVLNMTFDVPVKLFSFHLCILLILLILPDLGNIARFFILNLPTKPLPNGPYFLSKKQRYIGRTFKAILIFYVLYTGIDGKLQSQKLYGKRVPMHELYGIYEVQTFVINGDTIAPLMTDTRRWKQLIIDKRNSLLIKMDESRIGMSHKIDSATSMIKLMPYLEGYQAFELRYQISDSQLVLTDTRQNDTLIVTAKRRKREDYFLMQRGFHFINEYPMQR